MRLIRQVTLQLRQGHLDKVFEIDLCEVGTDKFVVNFRTGRRGSTLRDGSKTVIAVPRDEAERVFEDLVQSQEAKGYQRLTQPAAGAAPTQPASPVESGESDASPAAEPDRSTFSPAVDQRVESVIRRLSAGTDPNEPWDLSRAVWRCGELRIQRAEPLLIKLLGSADAMLDYCLVWALAQCGSPQSAGALREVNRDTSRPDHVRRLAIAALLEVQSGVDREAMLQQVYGQLPDGIAEWARQPVTGQRAEALREAIAAHLDPADPRTFGVLEMLYLINTPAARHALFDLLHEAPLEPPWFRRIRRIYKLAEMRRDGRMFGLLAYRFECSPARFAMTWRQRPKPTLGEDAKQAYSKQTRWYLVKRSWRTLRRLAELGSDDYVPMAAGLLSWYRDQDAVEPSTDVRFDYTDYRRLGTYRRELIQLDAFAPYLAFNRILYSNSPRYQAGRRAKEFFRCTPPYQPGQPAPPQREEAYPALWDRGPQHVPPMLARSCCERVHEFGVKVLAAAGDYCRQEMSVEDLARLLSAPYEVTTRFAFDLAVSRYDAANPDRQLLLALAGCQYEPARQQGQQWIRDNAETLLRDPEFTAAVICSSQSDTRQLTRELLRQTALPESLAQQIVARLVARLMDMRGGDELLAADVAETLLRALAPQARSIGEAVIRDLVEHPLAEVQQLAGDLILGHQTLSQAPPSDILQRLLDSEHPGVRASGVRILTALPDDALRGNPDLCELLIRHPAADVRDGFLSTLVRLAHDRRAFGEQMVERLIEALLQPGAPEGVPSYTARVIAEELVDFTSKIPAETVWRLLQSRSLPAQDVGGRLLRTNVNTSRLTIDQLVRLAHHDVLSVREASWQMCRDHLDRIRRDLVSAVGLLDGRWEDSREWARGFFREHLADAELMSPEILVGICDSVRPDVHQFGRELIGQLFQQQDGPELATKLSEHPAEAMQLFASNFLAEHIAGSTDRLEKLTPYILNVLSRVNRGRVAKQRTYQLLDDEAQRSLESAQVVAGILARQSVVATITDRATLIEIMTRLHARWPNVELPIQIQETPVR